MSADGLTAVVQEMGGSFTHILPYLLVAGVIFGVLTRRYACNPSGPWWHNRELGTDLCYWLVVPVFTRFLRIGLLVGGAAVVFGVSGERELIEFFDHGRGPFAQLPFWAQVLFYLLAADLLLYVSHRLFHNGRLWSYHAVHHSSEQVDWTSAARFHPVNLSLGTVLVDVILLLGGLPPLVLSVLVPFNVLMSAFVHANLNWTLGPFKYVIASPVFHRWHHTGVEQGGNKNFASTFPFLDVLFGTFYMPANELPSAYGVGDSQFPQSFGAQLLYPLRTHRREASA
jgi:sterol desaturase/sphingolipid hydroxylase (fatty acid hydroxylase superfamily)